LSLGGLTLLTTPLKALKSMVFWAPAFYLKKAMKKWQILLGKFARVFFPNKIIKQGNSQDPSIEPVLINSHFISEIHSVNSNDYLMKLNTPVLLVQGTADNQVKAELNYSALEYIPKDIPHKLHKVEGATHDFSGKYLDEFIAVSIDWLKQYLD
jgi:pimeloyl-ACP methyl ester carboxylesterase